MKASKKVKSENNLKKNYKYDFTIITVVKNDEKNIDKTIKSVLFQNKKNIQYIVADGFSNDNTFNKIQKYKNKLKILRFEDKSFYHGLNNAIRYSKGEYIGILNSGDTYFNRDVLKKVKKEIKNYDYLFGNILYVNSKKIITREWKFNKSIFKKIFFYYIAHTSLFISSIILKKKLKKYSTKYKISSDTDLLIRLNKLPNLRYKYLNYNLIYMQTGGLSTNITNVFKKVWEDLHIIYRHFGFLVFSIYLKKIIIKLNGIWSPKINKKKIIK